MRNTYITLHSYSGNKLIVYLKFQVGTILFPEIMDSTYPNHPKTTTMQVKIINNREVKIWTDYVEESAMRQIENLTQV